MSFKISSALWDKIHHFASFPQTGGEYPRRLAAVPSCQLVRLINLVSLQQMILFGQNPSQGTLLKASQFLAGKASRNNAGRNCIPTDPS
jgi:pyruvate dehydrogenase kinase 2/3/4